MVGPRKLREYSFRVPRERSRYEAGTGAKRRFVACEGRFAVDPTTAALVRLVVKSSEAPEASSICSAVTTLVCGGGMAGKGGEIPLPVRSVFELATADGKEARNEASYSGCHEFRAESTLRFDASTRGEQRRGLSTR